MKRPTIDDVYTLDAGHNVIEEGWSCAACVDTFNVGDRVLEVPMEPDNPKSRLIVTEHLHCAVRNDEIELNPKPEWNVFNEENPDTWPNTTSELVLCWVWIPDNEPSSSRQQDEWQCGSWAQWRTDAVTYWMPITVPEPPQEVK